MISEMLHLAQFTPVDLVKPLYLLMLAIDYTPTALLWQEHRPLEWQHLPVSSFRVLVPYCILVFALIIKGRTRMQQLFSMEPDVIVVPFTKSQLSWLYQSSEEWQIALADFTGQISFHYPADKLVHFFKNNSLIFPQIMRKTPIPNASLVFTDGSAKGVAAVVTDGQTHIKQCPSISTQRVELHAILLGISLLTNQAFNLYTDSFYLYQVLHTIKTALISHTVDEELFHLLLQLQGLIH
jgi:hypothetical protein